MDCHGRETRFCGLELELESQENTMQAITRRLYKRYKASHGKRSSMGNACSNTCI